MSVSPEARARTHVYARVLGPWLVLVPGTIAMRATDMGALAGAFFRDPLWIWFAGALLVFGGLLIIAFHQIWSSLAAVLISLFGWLLLLRGVTLMALPGLYEQVANAVQALWLIRAIFGVLVVAGLYLVYVGWLAKPPSAETD